MGNVCLDEVELPGTIKTVGDSAFEGCESLFRLTFGSGTTTIGSCVFKKCTNLQELTIPASVTSIGRNLFQDGSDFVMIFCKDGSAAQTYAEANELMFVIE